MTAEVIQSQPSAIASTKIYTREFWIAYIANLMLVTGNSMTFRFADWVVFNGGTNAIAGNMVSLGVFGAIVSRLALMHLIDRHGTRWQWIFSTVLFVAGVTGILYSPNISAQMWISRILYSIGVAGMFTCSVVHVQIGVPVYRRTEIIGMLGSSGFLGMMCGGILGDRIFHLYSVDDEHARLAYRSVFAASAILGVLYLLTVAYLTRKDEVPVHHEEQDLISTLFQHTPYFTLLIASLMGMGFAVNFVFLTRFATMNHLNMGMFYASYAICAFSFRLMTRNWNRLVGRYNMVLIGLFSHIIGQTLLSISSKDWHFLAPSVACGLGHSLLFPAVVSLGAGAFPAKSRGVGTTLVMGFIDVGSLICAPLLGYVIDEFGFSWMYCISIISHIIILIAYYIYKCGNVDPEQQKM